MFLSTFAFESTIECSSINETLIMIPLGYSSSRRTRIASSDIGKVRIESKFDHQLIRELKIIRFMKERMIILNELMGNIIILYRYNTQFAIFNLEWFPSELFEHSFISIILVIIHVERQGQECDHLNDNGSIILIVFTYYLVFTMAIVIITDDQSL